VLPRGGGTKRALSDPPDGVVPLEMGDLQGIIGYDPAELTLSALAGTRLAELVSTLAEAGQYLPFDPPLAPAGATIGGTVAAGLSGPGRHRHGGVRDFVIGVRFLDGTGELVTGGGQVVKNAAGFDLPKLLVGSLGRLGVIVEVSLKVLPAPPAWGTVRVRAGGLEGALAATSRLGRAGLDVEALDFEPSGEVSVRLGGPADGLERRLDRVAGELGLDGEHVLASADADLWAAARELEWAPDSSAVAKAATTPARVVDLDRELERAGAIRRYSDGGHVCWIAWPADATRERLDQLLREAGAGGVLLTGEPGPPLLGALPGGEFALRARRAVDPHGVFAEA
jgi:glycolate oxidase FAD binding subunit